MTKSADAPVILWFRDDLRLADHAALHAAAETGRPVLPVFILDDAFAGTLGAGRRLPLVAAPQPGSAAGRAGGARQPIDAAPRRQRRDHRRTRRADRRDRRLHRRFGRPLGAAGRPGRVARRLARQAAPDAHDDAVPSGLGAHQEPAAPTRVYTPFANACLALGGPKPPLPAPTTIRAAESASPTGWRTGTCCRPGRTGPAACATPGPRARPAPWSGPRRS